MTLHPDLLEAMLSEGFTKHSLNQHHVANGHILVAKYQKILMAINLEDIPRLLVDPDYEVEGGLYTREISKFLWQPFLRARLVSGI